MRTPWQPRTPPHRAGPVAGAARQTTRMDRAFMLVLAPLCLAGCAPSGPSDVERQAAVWKAQEAAQEARQDDDSSRTHQTFDRIRAVQDDTERQDAAHFATLVAAQQRASAALTPVMQTCLKENAMRRATGSTAPPAMVAQAVLGDCRPAIVAVARTVELARISSAGLADEITARLRRSVTALVIADRAQPRPAKLETR
jgi:hypothetical protein